MPILIAISIIAVCIGSIIPVSNQPVWYGQYLALLFTLYAFLSARLWKFNRILSILCFYIVFNTFFVTNMSTRSVVLTTQLLIAANVSQTVSTFDKKAMKLVQHGMIAAFCIQSGLLLLQILGHDPIFSHLVTGNTNTTVAFMGAKDQLGSYFAMMMPIIPLFLLPLSMLGVFLSASSFAFVASICGMLVLFNNKYLVIVALILGAIFFTCFEKVGVADFRTRLSVWEHSIEKVYHGSIEIETPKKIIISCNPMFGYGFGNFMYIFPYVKSPVNNFNYIDEKFNHAHNDFVEAFFELGYVGLFLLLALIASVIKKYVNSDKSFGIRMAFAVLVVFFVNAMGNFVSHMSVLGYLMAVSYGMFEGSLNG